jgi:tetratricopeptide (TPR) repeat protein
MDTLRYLAGALGKPMGYFLEEPSSVKEDPVCVARKAFRSGEYEAALATLAQLEQKDDEGWLLELMSLLALAEQAISEKKRPYALQLLESAGMALERTMYASDELRQRRLVLLSLIAPESAAELAEQLPQNDNALLLRARGALQQGNFEACRNYLNACEDRNAASWHLFAGELCFQSKEYAAAILHYKVAEEEFPEQCRGWLEKCYLAVEDYKQAYEYACKGRKEDTLC